MSMKTAKGRGIALGLGFSLAVLGAGVVGCGGEVGNAPTIDDTSLLVSCVADGSDYVWDFVALVDDLDGYDDVVDVYVNVIHLDMGDDPMGVLDLVAGSNGEWALTVYQSEASFLDCENTASYEFDFYAVDTAGLTDAVSTTAL